MTKFEAFSDSFHKLISRIEAKRALLDERLYAAPKTVLGIYKYPVEAEIKRLREQKSITRIWQKDATLWKDEPNG